MGKRELRSSWCLVTLIVLWLFLALPLVGLQCVIVVLPHHTHLLEWIHDVRELTCGDLQFL